MLFGIQYTGRVCPLYVFAYESAGRMKMRSSYCKHGTNALASLQYRFLMLSIHPWQGKQHFFTKSEYHRNHETPFWSRDIQTWYISIITHRTGHQKMSYLAKRYGAPQPESPLVNSIALSKTNVITIKQIKKFLLYIDAVNLAGQIGFQTSQRTTLSITFVLITVTGMLISKLENVPQHKQTGSTL